MHIDKKLCHFFTVNQSSLLRVSQKKTKVVLIISAPILSQYITKGELPKKVWDKSEYPKESHKPVEILGQNTKEMAGKSEKKDCFGLNI